jgi:zinc transporter ZupT
MLKQVLGFITGYAIFAVASLVLFKLSGHDPHQKATNTFILLTAIYGAVFSFLSGLVTPLLAKAKALTLNYILAIIIAGFALFSLLYSEGSHWTQVLTIIIFAPVSLLGGLFYKNKYKS